MKKYIIFAGVNGAGKSTLYSIKKDISGLKRINTDEIVREFGTWSNPNDVLKAGKIAVGRIADYFDNGVSFNQETTLCGKSIMRNIQKARKLGYYIDIYYVGVDSAELAIERIAHRVKTGGHGIPDEDVRRRYQESMDNLKQVINLAHHIVLYDNTVGFNRFAEYREGNLIFIKDIYTPEWYKNNFTEI